MKENKPSSSRISSVLEPTIFASVFFPDAVRPSGRPPGDDPLDLVDADRPFRPGPHRQRQLGDRLLPFGGGQRRRAAALLHPLLFQIEPVLEQLAVQLGGRDLAVLSPGLLELILRQLGDEAEHPRGAGQALQVLDVADQVETALGGDGQINRRLWRGRPHRRA